MKKLVYAVFLLLNVMTSCNKASHDEEKEAFPPANDIMLHIPTEINTPADSYLPTGENEIWLDKHLSRYATDGGFNDTVRIVQGNGEYRISLYKSQTQANGGEIKTQAWIAGDSLVVINSKSTVSNYIPERPNATYCYDVYLISDVRDKEVMLIVRSSEMFSI